jgi:mannosyltransferase
MISVFGPRVVREGHEESDNSGRNKVAMSGDLDRLDVIIPNLHWRYSGVTATNRMVAPRAAELVNARWMGRDRPDGMRKISLGQILRLSGRDRPVVWHARRNNEMIVGLLLRTLGIPLKLLFTSAGQRQHTWLTRWLIARMDAVIATTAKAASYLKRDATVINHGVDVDLYAPATAEEKTATGAAGARYAIGCFGRVRPQKGTDLFVEAMCTLLPRYPDFYAVIVGASDNASFVNGLKRQVEQAGLTQRVLFLGELPIDDVRRWFRRLSIYAFTSRNEGFGLTLLEAMAVGAALVAARAGAAEDVIADGETGLLVPPGDTNALARALETLMADPQRAQSMARRARERVVDHFTIEKEVGRIVEVYRRLLDRQSSTNASRSPPGNR